MPNNHFTVVIQAAAPILVTVEEPDANPIDLSIAPPPSIEVQIPAGYLGPRGFSAYQLAVANGFVGTEAEWLDSLTGVIGPMGESVTTVVLTEAEYLALSAEAQLNPLIFYIIPE